MFSVLSAALILVSGVFLSATSAGSGTTITAACSPPTTAANGCTGVVIDQSIFATDHYAPNKAIYVHHDGWITVKDTTQDTHSFTLVQGSLLPKTVAAVNNCGLPPPAPVTICLVVLGAHLPGAAPPTVTPPYSNSCVAVASPAAYQCVDGGVGLPNGSPFPHFNTPFTMTTGGDSIILFPGDSFSVQITAPAGTVLHFMCVIHPWMQGEIIVTS